MEVDCNLKNSYRGEELELVILKVAYKIDSTTDCAMALLW